MMPIYITTDHLNPGGDDVGKEEGSHSSEDAVGNG